MRSQLWLALSLFAALIGHADSARLEKRAGAAPLLKVQAQAGSEIQVEKGGDLLNWSLLSILSATNESSEFADPFHTEEGNMFYRVTSGPAQPRLAKNFRLIDHLGRSQELYYHWPNTNISAFVLIFTGNGCSSISNALPALKNLNTQYAPAKVQFWMINSKAGDARTNIAKEATALGIPWPILHDRSQAVAQGYAATASPHVVLVDRETMDMVYNGPLDAGDGNASDLARALSAWTDRQAPAIRYLVSAGCDLALPALSDLSYSADIAPILQNKCVGCHRPEGVAPWAMTNHNIVNLYAPLIEYEVMSRHMPPWHPDPEFGTFANDISLSVSEEQKLLAWVRAGAPRGEGPDPLENVPPPPPKWPVELGEPDMVIKCPEQNIKGSGVEDYRYIFVPSGIPSNVWLRAAVVRPSNPSVVHHYIVWEGQSSQQMATGIAGYVPGNVDRPFPPNTGVALNKDVWLTFNLHYTPNGEATTDQPELALWFHRTPPSKQLQTLPLLVQSLNIPPGAMDHQVTASVPVPFAATIYRLSPHMHLRGARMRFEVRYPNGTRETLLSIPKYHFGWQMGYYLQTPKVLPAGSTLTIIGAFDNSALNPHNPDPAATVHWGEQSWEEMFIGYVDFTL